MINSKVTLAISLSRSTGKRIHRLKLKQGKEILEEGDTLLIIAVVTISAGGATRQLTNKNLVTRRSHFILCT